MSLVYLMGTVQRKLGKTVKLRLLSISGLCLHCLPAFLVCSDCLGFYSVGGQGVCNLREEAIGEKTGWERVKL